LGLVPVPLWPRHLGAGAPGGAIGTSGAIGGTAEPDATGGTFAPALPPVPFATPRPLTPTGAGATAGGGGGGTACLGVTYPAALPRLSDGTLPTAPAITAWSGELKSSADCDEVGKATQQSLEREKRVDKATQHEQARRHFLTGVFSSLRKSAKPTDKPKATATFSHSQRPSATTAASKKRQMDAIIGQKPHNDS